MYQILITTTSTYNQAVIDTKLVGFETAQLAVDAVNAVNRAQQYSSLIYFNQNAIALFKEL